MILHYVIAVFIAFLWGTAPYIQKTLAKGIHPYEFLVISGACYAITIVLSLLVGSKLIEKETRLDWKNGFQIFLFSLIFIFIPNLLFLFLLSGNNVRQTTALTYTSPAFMILIGYLFFSNSITATHIIGVVFLIMGALLLVS